MATVHAIVIKSERVHAKASINAFLWRVFRLQSRNGKKEIKPQMSKICSVQTQANFKMLLGSVVDQNVYTIASYLV
jgi:hypothetical protein